MSHLCEVIPSQPRAFGTPLNEREKQVLCGMFQGYEDREIATRLNSTVQSIKNSRKMAYRKLGINSVRGLFPLIIAGNFELRTGESVSLQ